jgi:hypothetical protein
VIRKAIVRQDIGWFLFILAAAAAAASAAWAIRSGYLRRRRDGQPASAVAYLAVGLWLLVDTAAFNLVFPGAEIAAMLLAVFCLVRAVQLRRRSGAWR